MNILAWILVLLAIPVLLLGEFLVRRIRNFERFNIPVPVIGGLLVSLVILVGNVAEIFPAQFDLTTTARWWTWLVTPEPEWQGAPAKIVYLSLLVGFFACIGLNASWSLVKRGNVQVILLLLVAACLAIIQNVVGVALARLLGVSPLFGLVCASVALTGGHGTALGFAPDLAKVGLENAAVVGTAAATFGLVTGGPLGGTLIRRRSLRSEAAREFTSKSGRPARLEFCLTFASSAVTDGNSLRT